MYINIPREDSVFSLLKSYLDLNFEVMNRADNSRCANNDYIRLVNMGPIALFSKFKLTTSIGKHLEAISQAHIVSLLYILLTSARGSDDLFIGFGRNRKKIRDELTINKNIRSKYLVRILLNDVYGFAEHQDKATYGLGL